MSELLPKPLCHCGSKVTVVDVRTGRDDRVHRRMRCRTCGDTYKTVEIRKEEYERVKSLLLEIKSQIRNNRRSYDEHETENDIRRLDEGGASRR